MLTHLIIRPSSLITAHSLSMEKQTDALNNVSTVHVHTHTHTHPHTRMCTHSYSHAHPHTHMYTHTHTHTLTLQSNECVQVECYLQNEGALVRFWYPVVYLERPPPGYRKSSALRGSDAANMLVHRELLRCEAALSSMYCRRTLLLVQQSSSHTNEELLDHLRLISAECLADPLCEGLSMTTSPDLAPSPSTALQTLNLSPLHIFYASIDRVTNEIRSAIDSVEGGRLDLLSQQICDCLQRTPQNFGCTELKITENKEVFDITYPDAVMMVVSCVDDKSVTKPPPRYVKLLW